VAVAYPRRGRYVDDPRDPAPLTAEQLALIREVQNELHVAYTEQDYTRELPFGGDHRLPGPCEFRTYELTGVKPAAADNGYLTPDALRDLKLNPTLDTAATRQVVSLDYQQRPRTDEPHKRLVEHAVTRYFKDDLSGPRALGRQSRLGLTYENYKLALTDSLLSDVLVSAPGQDGFAAEAQAALGQAGARAGFLASGYQRGTAVLGARGAGQWWMRSGVAGFAASAPDHFYLPERYFDPFGNETSLAYDGDDLFVRSSSDSVGNRTRVIRFDHRVLAPSRVEDHNVNVTAAAFDVFGLPVATAQMGKVSAGPPETAETGDTVEGFSFANLNPDPDRVADFFLSDPFDAAQARKWLGKATARFLYHFGESTDARGRTLWGTTAAGACGIVRELHQRDAPNTPAAEIPIQATVEYSDGTGQTFVKKIQAESDPEHPERGIRWIANGKTIVNNKGNPVLQYEPYFSDSGHRFDEPHAVGISPILYYDAPGRLIRTEYFDGSVSRIEFSPWLSRSYDQNDTVLDPGNRWYAEHTAPGAETEEKRAARLAALHAGTPAETHFDSLGRSVIAIARNRSPDQANAPATATSVADWLWKEERYLTFTKLDAEGKPLWICDAHGNLVMQYIAPPGPDHTPLYDVVGRDYHPAYVMPPSSVPCYDIAGNLLFQHSMDAGDRRTLIDATGQPLLAWDYNERKDATTPRLFKEHRRFRVVYDSLHRPLERWLRVRDEVTGTIRESLIERNRYGEGVAHDTALNLRGKIWQHYDSSGVAQTDEFDASDKPCVSQRRLASDIETPVLDWSGVQLEDIHVQIAASFEPEVFTQRIDYDALGRATRTYNWHVESPNNSGRSDRVAVYLPSYNERGLLAKETLLVWARKTPDGHQIVPGRTRRQDAIKRIDYDAKSQKTRLDCGNGTVTQYDNDPKTFRLRVLRTTRPGYSPRFPSKRGQLSDARVLQHLFYSYDASGNITEIQDDAWTPAFFDNQRVEAASRYVYDSIDRLVEASGRENGRATGAPPQLTAATMLAAFPDSRSGALRNYVERYRYDAVGNIETMRHIAGPRGSWTRTYDYETTSNRLTGTDTDNPGRAVRYGYDTHGSMTNLNAAPERFDLRWDWNDMIHTIDLGGGGRAWYQYGADKQRCRKRIDRQHNTTGSWERIYLPGFELYRRYGGGAARGAPVEEIETHHLLEREQRVLLVDDVITAADVAHPRPDGLPVHQQTLFRYQYSNLLGSASLELDDTMELISYEEYHPYGSAAYHAVNSTLEAPPKRYRYAGLERDEESGLGYHRARYCAPWLTRWCSSDPQLPKEWRTRYSYCSDSPVTRFDRYGEADNRRVAEIGELALQQTLDDAFPGRFFVFHDPEKDVSATGFDLFAYDRKPPGRFVVFDNKAAGEIRDVGAFERYTRYIPEARRVIARYGDTEEAALALSAIARNDYQLIASNFFSPTEGRVSRLLFDQGYHFLDVRTGTISETYDEMLKTSNAVSGAALRSSEGRLVGGLRRGGGTALGVALVVLLAGSAAYAGSSVGPGARVDLGDVQVDIEATRALRASAKTPAQQIAARGLTTYSSLLIKWEIEEELTARARGRGGDDPVKEAVNPFNFTLGGVLAGGSAWAQTRTDVMVAVGRAEASLARLEQGLTKNELTLTDSERAAFRNRILLIWGWKPDEAAAYVAGF
jgi:RHS repeat-associated protein